MQSWSAPFPTVLCWNKSSMLHRAAPDKLHLVEKKELFSQLLRLSKNRVSQSSETRFSVYVIEIFEKYK